jgi:hypothetical protein
MDHPHWLERTGIIPENYDANPVVSLWHEKMQPI